MKEGTCDPYALRPLLTDSNETPKPEPDRGSLRREGLGIAVYRNFCGNCPMIPMLNMSAISKIC
jgi:hypothetical protein